MTLNKSENVQRLSKIEHDSRIVYVTRREREKHPEKCCPYFLNLLELCIKKSLKGKSRIVKMVNLRKINSEVYY